MAALLPEITEPTGAPRPFEKHIETVSNCAASAATEAPWAMAALHRRAPSRCMGMPWVRANEAISLMSRWAQTTPPPRLWVFSTQMSRVGA